MNDMDRKSVWTKFDKLAAALLAATIALLSINYLGRHLEGLLFPVMTPFEISKVTPVKNGTVTKLAGSSTKLRDCDWQATKWYIGKFGPGERSAQVPAEHRGPPQIRNRGMHHWDDLVIGLPSDLLCATSFAFVEHKCHPFWTTTTVFWDSQRDSCA